MNTIFDNIEKVAKLADQSSYLNFYFVLSKYGNYQLHIAVNDSKIDGINGKVLKQPLDNVIQSSIFCKFEETLYLLNDIELMVKVELECQKEIDRETTKKIREEKAKQDEENKKRIKEERINAKVEKEKVKEEKRREKERKRRANVKLNGKKRDKIS